MNELSTNQDIKRLYADIHSVLTTARNKVYTAVNFTMVQSIGR